MQKLKIAVLYGGPSAEHDVSVKSGKNVIKNLDREKYHLTPVFIRQDNSWFIDGGPGLTVGTAIDRLKYKLKIELAFLVLHGPFGEDGTIQGLLTAAGICFTGSGVLASALAMNKMQSWHLYREAGLTVPKQVLVHSSQSSAKPPLDLPCVIKPNALGSTIGVTIARSLEEFQEGMKLAFQYGPELVVQEFIAGTEVTCGVLDDDDPVSVRALLPTEIVPKTAAFFDYAAKYAPDGSDEITPARLPQSVISKIQEIAVRAHQVLDCRAISRSDFIMAADGTPYLLETNTIPGLTETSLIPRALKVMGLTYPELLELIIRASLIPFSD